MVEYVSIGSLLTRKRDKAKKIGGNAPVYAVTNNKGFALSSDLHDFTIHSEDTSNYMVVERNDFAYNPSRLNIGSIAYFKNDGKGLISPMYVVFHADENIVLPEYLFIVLKSEAVRNKIDSLKEEGARFRFDFKRWDLIKIPVPSLEEQTRIVGILDTFTSAIDNLKEQIAQRRKQYEYYRDQLLDLEGKPGVEMKMIEEITKRNKGIPITAEQMSELASINGNIRVFAAGATMADIDEDDLPKNCAHRLPSVIVKSRGHVDFEFYEGPFTHKNEMWSYSFESKEKAKYLYYFLTTKTDYFRKKAKTNSVKLPQLCVADTDKYKIPIPSLDEQARIVSILDTFEASVANLEAQLELRQKQYEYYRNKLLTFEK